MAHKCGRTHAAQLLSEVSDPPTSIQTQTPFICPLKLLITLFCTTEHMSKHLIFITRFRLMNATIFKHHETVQYSMRRRNLVRVDIHHRHATQA